MGKIESKQHQVSAGNPCPFLRALVAAGKLSDERESLATVAKVVSDAARAGDGEPALPRTAVYAIAVGANGLGPLSLIDAFRFGLKLNALRGGPLDKNGAGSGILSARGTIDAKEVARLRTFAQAKPLADGSSELGLGLPELRAYMDANFARAAGHRRAIDRTLMIGEWPVLLKVMGKESLEGRYLSLPDVIGLFKERRFPKRMTERMAR